MLREDKMRLGVLKASYVVDYGTKKCRHLRSGITRATRMTRWLTSNEDALQVMLKQQRIKAERKAERQRRKKGRKHVR